MLVSLNNQLLEKPNIAILLFSQSPKVEARRKHWLGKKRFEDSHRLARALLRQVKQALASSPFPVFHFTEREQEGQTFGERFAKAYQKVFSLGYGQVIGIGGDVPGLSSISWKEVESSLIQGNAVLGPDKRGGSYLIALSQEQFDYQSFADLPWQSPNTYQSLKAYLSGEVMELPPLLDLNTFEDLKSLVKGPNTGAWAWIQWLRQLLSRFSFRLFTTYLPILAPQPFLRAQSFRGPPF